MKRLCIFTFVACVIQVCAAQSQSGNNLFLRANLSNTTQSLTKVTVGRMSLGRVIKITDTCLVSGNNFSYQAYLSEPEYLILNFYWHNGKSTRTAFWAEPFTYNLNIGENLRATVAEPEHGVASQLKKLEKSIAAGKKKLDSLIKNISYENQKIEDVEKRIAFLRDSSELADDKNIYYQTILNSLNSPLGLYALIKYADRPYENQRLKAEPESIEKLLKQLSPEIRQLPSAKLLQNKLATSKKMSIGQLMPSVSLPDTAGKIYSINDFKGKYILVDFWASWCVPCREESPYLLSAFKKYKVSGFQVISITIDEPSLKKAWTNAIQKDRVNQWPQLSDFERLAQNTFDIKFIPANYLIDREGRIIARDLRGEKLIQFLEGLAW